jgi:hypothetical protein
MLLFRIVFVVVFSGIAAFCPWVRTIVSANGVLGVLGVALAFYALSFALTGIAGNASRGVALRPVIVGVGGPQLPDPSRDTPNCQRWYIESTVADGKLPHSCSFVEFDERGDYLDFHQHAHAYQKVQALAQEQAHLIVVIFVHGWRNNGHSGNVVSMNEFLHQLAAHSNVGGVEHRVHGIYISWRGACLKHSLTKDKTFTEVTKRFGDDPIVDLNQAAKFPRLNDLLETFSYFDRKKVPEHLISGTSLSRTLFTCAHVAKRFRPNSHIFLIGHSFGGLTLERTFQNACIAELVDGWPWDDVEVARQTRANPLPFDTVLLVNSAAPSIYAKQLQSFMAAHCHAMARNKVVGAHAPVFFSLTSSGDWATGKIHRYANALCFLVPTLRRFYKGNDFILARGNGSDEVEIQQSYYYRHTPGHNPLLVNRFIEPDLSPDSLGEDAPSAPLRSNLATTGTTLKFSTSNGETEADRRWAINFPPQTDEYKHFSRYPENSDGFLPVVWEKNGSGNYAYRETAYWIIRCPAEIIKDHNDIWNQKAMDTYAALYAISVALKKEVVV